MFEGDKVFSLFTLEILPFIFPRRTPTMKMSRHKPTARPGMAGVKIELMTSWLWSSGSRTKSLKCRLFSVIPSWFPQCGELRQGEPQRILHCLPHWPRTMVAMTSAQHLRLETVADWSLGLHRACPGRSSSKDVKLLWTSILSSVFRLRKFWQAWTSANLTVYRQLSSW